MTYIDLRRIRDFNQTINIATEYLRQNFVILSKATLAIVLPILLLGLLFFNVGMYFLGRGMGLMDNSSSVENSEMYALIIGGSIVGLSFLLAIGIVVNIVVLYEHMRLYSLTTQPQTIELRQLLHQMKRKAGLYIKTTIGLYFLFILAYIGVIMVVGIVSAMLSFLGIELLTLLGFLISIPLSLYIITAISMLYIVRTVEGLRFFDSVRRCFTILNDHFWQTAGLYIITYLIIMSVTAVPLWVATGFVSSITLFDLDISSAKLTAFLTISEIIYLSIYLIVNSLGMLVVAFRYFSLVEQREAIGLLRKIELIGQHETIGSLRKTALTGNKL